MPASTDPLVLGLTWSALTLATALYASLVRRRVMERRKMVREVLDAVTTFQDGLTRLSTPGSAIGEDPDVAQETNRNSAVVASPATTVT